MSLTRVLLALVMLTFGVLRPPAAEPVVWLDYTQAELDRVYDQAVYAPNLAQVLKRQAANSVAARQAIGEPRRLAYGSNATEHLDVYPTAAKNAPIHIYIHGGTWRFGRARDNAFAAELFVRGGAHFVVPDFASVTDHDGNLQPLVDQLRSAIVWVYHHAAAEFGGDRDRIHLSGFSSGGHLAAVMLITDWTRLGLPANVLKSGLIVSGMYDLDPVALSSRREYVTLHAPAIARLSPIHHLNRITGPLIIAHGTLETPEFKRQAREFHRAGQAHGLAAELLIIPESNHFETIETLANPYAPLGRAALRLMGLDVKRNFAPSVAPLE
ncbi:alpha/beta hydrolase [Synoicihabitans lomoniglobus]|uniref:Alpha/beta hydrolase n=1 Tax=Synoicihabitans lomoniglobus TaxID=2909285 RepID=A0AAF0CPX7_9BACT|nr:alpha/beta hydrolase [Opitutaceae bacterium LMO-M01]WED65903.1 alpha/beta hydrolase [Opitutaceae bacterium LMO-M01]